jgi:hypothetical protein
MVPQNSSSVRVERALPVSRGVPRAEAVVSSLVNIDETLLANPENIGKWVAMQIPGEGAVWARYRGEIRDVNALPTSARRWDWYYTHGGTSWIYMAPAATGRLGWMDP